MSLSLEDKVQKCIKTPLKSSSDQTAWAIASKWMSHFVFICWRGGHSVKIDAFGSRPGNTPIISPQKPLQRAGLSAAERRNTRESSDRSHVSVSVWFHLSSVVSPTCAWNYPASLQAFIHFNSVVALSVMFLLYCRVSLAASGVKGQKTFRAVSWSPESEPALLVTWACACLTGWCSEIRNTTLFFMRFFSWETNINVLKKCVFCWLQLRVRKYSLNSAGWGPVLRQSSSKTVRLFLCNPAHKTNQHGHRRNKTLAYFVKEAAVKQ